MTGLDRILDVTNHGDRATAEFLAGHAGVDVAEVQLAAQFSDVDEARTRSLLVFDRDLSQICGTYRFDIAVRRAVSRNVAGVVVFVSDRSKISQTAVAIARKTNTALIRLDASTDVSSLVQAMARRATDELHLTVDRAREAARAIGQLDRQARTVDDLIELTSVFLGRSIELRRRGEALNIGAIAVPAVVTDAGGDWLTVMPIGQDDADLLELVLWRLAAEVSRVTFEAGHSRSAKRQSSAEVLLQLLDADRATRVDLVAPARRVGIQPEGWHAIARFEFDNLHTLVADEAESYSTRERLATLALDTMLGRVSSCHVAHDPKMLVVLWTDDHAPAAEDGLALHRSMVELSSAMADAVPGLRYFAGVGTMRAELSGLAMSATEARLAASAARSRRRVNYPTSFDALGLQQTLVEWYGSPTVRESADSLLAPLRDLTGQKSAALTETLCTYLDEQGSVANTATRLHLHRNAVRYRVRQAFELLDVDPDDPDQRLFLHLALRAERGR
ncbi:PucR family transcriptional regulator [Desertimonas flava]|uniref:PucR family transcriptional regulator n=1 Tax=Desertimonas flava TaxID=2064846 RepID=UPI0013C51B3C|nr:helix-turn-helix domain-containing protein [Desertimonas flava]